MSIINGHCPLPNSFIATVNSLSLTHREKNLLKVIGEEIYRFPEGRETLSKELASRYLESLTGIKRNHISVILNKFQSRGFIKYIKSHVKGRGSIIILTLGTVPVPDNNELGTAIGHGDNKLGTATVPNPKNLSIKEDPQKEDLDSSLNFQIEQAIEENPQKNSLNSSNESNLNMPAINLLTAAAPPVKNDFTSLGSVLSSSCVTDNFNLSHKAISTGKAVLLKKGFSSSEATIIIDRISLAMTGKDIKSKDKYFIACCNKETRRSNKSSVHNTSQKIAAPISCPSRPIATEKEVKQAPPAAELLEKIKLIAPTELFHVIMTVDSDLKTQRALEFLPGKLKEEALTGLYVAAFKEKFPDRYTDFLF